MAENGQNRKKPHFLGILRILAVFGHFSTFYS